jgi:hypothetical protein
MPAYHGHAGLAETGTVISVFMQPADQCRQSLRIAGNQIGQRVRQRQSFGGDRRHDAGQSGCESLEHLPLDAGP